MTQAFVSMTRCFTLILTHCLYLNITSIKISSLNCRGLRDNKKRKDVFKYLREKKSSIYCLQDTHLVDSDLTTVYTQWGFDCMLSQGRNDSRGVLNLFNNNFDYTIHRTKKDSLGNLLVSEIKLTNRITISLVNIYGPNSDEYAFFERICDILEEFDNEFVIICGDWNLTQDFNLDCYNYINHGHPRSRSVVEKLKNNYNLVDPWRIQNPDKKEYTWHRTNPIKQSRLDFFLISNELMSLVRKVNIMHGYRTDHSYIELEITISDFQKAPGFWRFNNSLLRDISYVQKVKECILKTKQEYTPLPILKDKIPEIPEISLPLTIDDDLFFDMMLMNIRRITIPYCSNKKRLNQERKDKIIKDIEETKSRFDNTHNEQDGIKLTDLNKELEQIRKIELEGLLIRTHSQWIEDGEKPTKYFCNLEKEIT